jgi:hypothetical protein
MLGLQQQQQQQQQPTALTAAAAATGWLPTALRPVSMAVELSIIEPNSAKPTLPAPSVIAPAWLPMRTLLAPDISTALTALSLQALSVEFFRLSLFFVMPPGMVISP